MPSLQQPSSAARPLHDTAEIRVARGSLLDSWLAHAWDDGVQIDRIDSLQPLRIETRNSTYDVAVVAGATGEVLVRGGRFFPDWTPAVLLGSSLGGGLLKRLGIHVGLRMELHAAGRTVITSAVQAIALGIEPQSDQRPPVCAAPVSPTHQTR